jgi:hypothetical protein
MKVTFERVGHANNSSSSHSIIFAGEHRIKTYDEYDREYFGWDGFLLADVQSKARYVASQLDIEPILLERTGFYEVVGEFLSEDELLTFKEHILSYGLPTIDHESVVVIPTTNRQGEVDYSLFQAYLREMLSKNYVIVGGNDNDLMRSEHYDFNVIGTPMEVFMKTGRFSEDGGGLYVKNLFFGGVKDYAYDEDTGEFILRLVGGQNSSQYSIKKIKFDKVA